MNYNPILKSLPNASLLAHAGCSALIYSPKHTRKISPIK